MKRRVMIGLLVCLLVFDIGTPLLPGAFRFNPDESIDVLCQRVAPAVAFAADSLLSRRHPERLTVPQGPEKGSSQGPVPVLRMKELFPRRITGTPLDSPSTSPEDH